MLKTYRLNFSWDKDTEDWLRHQKKGSTLNICCGMSRVGDIRADLDRTIDPDIVCDVHYPPFRANSFDTVICDPPFSIYNRFRWLHGLARLVRYRLILSNPSTVINLRRGRWTKTLYATESASGKWTRFLRLWTFFDKIPLEASLQ